MGRRTADIPHPAWTDCKKPMLFTANPPSFQLLTPTHRSSPLLQGHAASGSLVLKNEYCCCKIKALVALHLPLPQGSRAPGEETQKIGRTFPTTHQKPIKSYAKSTQSLHSYLEVYYLLHLRYLFRFHAVS